MRARRCKPPPDRMTKGQRGVTLKTLLAGLLLATAFPAAAALTAPEKKMTATVDAEYERSVALLEKLVNRTLAR